MATEMPPVNGGSYGAVPQYNAAELPAHTPSSSAVNGANGQTAGAPSTASSEPATDNTSTDEVGWYFVESYYTTMSKTPEKLHLYYAKKSQFVSGVEDEKVSVSVGQRAISETIKGLAIEDCKVRVTNVDSQESSDKSIVVQVIGELSMKSEPHRKFVQTFVLAKQHNGYYVLNDIFRYLAEEEDDEAAESQPEPEAVSAPEPEAPVQTLSSSDNLAEQDKSVEQVDKLLEEKADEQPAAVAASEKEPTPEPEPVAEEPTPEPEPAEESAAEEVAQPEEPKDPEPTRAASPKPVEAKPAPAQEQPAAPSKPSAPKTWASMFSAGGQPKPAVPAVPTTSPAPTQPKKSQVPAPSAVSTSSAANEDNQPPASPGGWQTAGQDNGKKQGRQQSGSVSAGGDNGHVLGYIKNVTERVDASILKNTLNKYGKLEYFDVSRQKNCAFVEFADRAGYEAAVAANPHSIGGETVYVEERRPRPNAYGGQYNRGGGVRGGRGSMDGRPPSQGGRGGQGGRGNFGPRGGRGGTVTPRGGRGQPQAA